MEGQYCRLFFACQRGWGLSYRRGKSDTPLLRARSKCDAIETEVYVVCTAQIEIRTGINVIRTKLAKALNLRGKITETKLVADVIWMRHKSTSEKMKLNGNDLQQEPKSTNLIHFPLFR
jgi:hypothetical protein